MAPWQTGTAILHQSRPVQPGSLELGRAEGSGGFLSHRATSTYHPLILFWNILKPSIFGYPHLWEPHLLTDNINSNSCWLNLHWLIDFPLFTGLIRSLTSIKPTCLVSSIKSNLSHQIYHIKFITLLSIRRWMKPLNFPASTTPSSSIIHPPSTCYASCACVLMPQGRPDSPPVVCWQFDVLVQGKIYRKHLGNYDHCVVHFPHKHSGEDTPRFLNGKSRIFIFRLLAGQKWSLDYRLEFGMIQGISHK